jgi:hypothetical protein
LYPALTIGSPNASSDAIPIASRTLNEVIVGTPNTSALVIPTGDIAPIDDIPGTPNASSDAMLVSSSLRASDGEPKASSLGIPTVKI